MYTYSYFLFIQYYEARQESDVKNNDIGYLIIKQVCSGCETLK